MTKLTKIKKIYKIFRILCEAYDVFCSLQRYQAKRRKSTSRVNRCREEEELYTTFAQQLELDGPEQFFTAVRMDKARFRLLLSVLEEKLTRTSQRRPISPQIRLATTLVYLSQGCNINLLSFAFKIGKSTARCVIYDTCQAIWEELNPIYIPVPKESDWEHIAEKFYEETGLPNCLGAIDGKIIKVKCPNRSRSLYISDDKRSSIALLAACDSEYIFTLMDVGAVCNQSDGGVSTRGVLGQMVLEDTLPTPAAKCLPGSDIAFPYYFVADAAFPLRPNIMRPYPGRNLPADASNFNRILSETRVRIETAFSILSNRWNVLHTVITASPFNVDQIVLATVALHNFLMLNKDGTYFTERDVDLADATNEDNLPSASLSYANRSARGALELRDTLKDFLQGRTY